MALVAGIDPGASGAIAVYDTTQKRIITMQDIPTWFMTVSKKKRKRIDVIAMAEVFLTLEMMGVELVVIEAVGGRPGQSASAGFAFGYTVGVIYTLCIVQHIMIETTPPQTWKKLLNVPGKGKASDDDIFNRTMELLPHDRDFFKGPNGGKKIDRCEAALLAKFGGDHILPTMPPLRANEPGVALSYQNADTGA